MSLSSFQLAPLRDGLKPFRLHWLPCLRSTNDHAAVLRKRHALFAPAIVLTGHQTAGRGRGGNTWWSRSGVLTVTFVFPTIDQIAPHQVPLLAGLAVREAAAGMVPGAPIQLKWPNDLLVEGRKLAGLLCERVNKVDLIGLGMNINLDVKATPRPLRDRITSLRTLAGHPLDMTAALIALARALRPMLTHRNDQTFGELLRQYDRHHALLGRRVRISNGSDTPIAGKCEGLDPMGRLLVRDSRTLHRTIAGHVALL